MLLPAFSCAFEISLSEASWASTTHRLPLASNLQPTISCKSVSLAMITPAIGLGFFFRSLICLAVKRTTASLPVTAQRLLDLSKARPDALGLVLRLVGVGVPPC